MSAIMSKGADPLVAVRKVWGKTKPVRYVAGLAFILHGWLHLGADLASMQEPFILSDLRDWAGWASERWQQLQGYDVKVTPR